MEELTSFPRGESKWSLRACTIPLLIHPYILFFRVLGNSNWSLYLHACSFVRHSEGCYDAKFFAEASHVEAGDGGRAEEALLLDEGFSEWPVIASEGATAALLSMISEGRAELETSIDDMRELLSEGLRDTKKIGTSPFFFDTFVPCLLVEVIQG